MGKTIQELQEMLDAKMKEVDAIQAEIAHAQMIEQVHGKVDLMIDFVLADDKLCKQIALLETEDCDEIGRKWAKSLGTLVKKALEGDATAEPKTKAKKAETSVEPEQESPKEEAVTAPQVEPTTTAEDANTTKKPRKPRAKKNDAPEPKPQTRQREKWTTEAIEQEAQEKAAEAMTPTAAADETFVEGSATAGGIIMEQPEVPKKPVGSTRMFNPARMMAERTSKK